MWVDDLEQNERKVLNMLAGNLNLPELSEYSSKVHFLYDVYSRIRNAGSVASQLNKLLNA